MLKSFQPVRAMPRRDKPACCGFECPTVASLGATLGSTFWQEHHSVAPAVSAAKQRIIPHKANLFPRLVACGPRSPRH